MTRICTNCCLNYDFNVIHLMTMMFPMPRSPERAKAPLRRATPYDKNSTNPISPERAISIAHTMMTPFQGLIWMLVYGRRALPYAGGCKGFALIIARHPVHAIHRLTRSEPMNAPPVPLRPVIAGNGPQSPANNGIAGQARNDGVRRGRGGVGDGRDVARNVSTLPSRVARHCLNCDVSVI